MVWGLGPNRPPSTFPIKVIVGTPLGKEFSSSRATTSKQYSICTL